MRRRPPAYGKPLIEARMRGMVPADLFIRLDAWHDGQPALGFVVVPPDTAPQTLDWSFAAGVDCIVAWQPSQTPYERLHTLCTALFEHEARRVWVLNREDHRKSFFAKSVELGIEMLDPQAYADANEIRQIFVLAGDRLEGIAYATGKGYTNLEIQHIEDARGMREIADGYTLHVLPGASRRANYRELMNLAQSRFRIEQVRT